MDPVLISLIAVFGAPVLGFIGIVVGGRFNRLSAKEANATDRFEAFMTAAEARIQRLEEQVKELEQAKTQLAKEIAALTASNVLLTRVKVAQARYIVKLQSVIHLLLPDLPASESAVDVEDADLVHGAANDYANGSL